MAVIIAATAAPVAAQSERSASYAAVQARLQQGWNSWDTSTVAGQVLLPYGLEIRLGVKKASAENTDAFLDAALIGRKTPDAETVFPGPRSYDGRYTELTLDWRGVRLKLETAHVGDDLVMLATPLSRPAPARGADAAATPARDTFRGMGEATSQPPIAVFSVGMVWNRPGSVAREGEAIVAHVGDRSIPVFAVGTAKGDLHLPVMGPTFAFPLDQPAGISTGTARSLAQVEAIVARARADLIARTAAQGKVGAVRGALETVLGWDTIYDPDGQRVLSPVSRIWNLNWGGYVVFDWDTFFAGTMAAAGNRDLAYANVLEVLNEVTPDGFVPNYARAAGWKSWDRSEPPVGSMTVLGLYRRFHERWLLEDTYARLLRWNEWWPKHRQLSGYLVWGSDADTHPSNPDDLSVGTLQGAKYESGLDNSPMYDGAGFDGRLMQVADVGLISLYVADCDALAQIADELGHKTDAAVLRAGAAQYRRALASLWDAKSGIFRNKDLRSGALSQRLSPTSFYPLLAGVVKPVDADRMIREHLLNPQEFGGERMIPSIARNDPAFGDQDYWRGRIWGPMNYLVWLGLGHYHTPIAQAARRQLGENSLALFLGEWQAKGHVHENYSAVSANSDTVATSDWFYHWGGLLGLIGPGVDDSQTQESQTRPHRHSMRPRLP